MPLDQSDVAEMFQAMGTGAWTIVYDSWYADNKQFGGTYSALLPERVREKVLGGPGWDLLKRSHGPGFSQGMGESGEWETRYEVGIDRDSVQPLILVREYHGIAPDVLEVEQEFRLFHNLYTDPVSGNIWKPLDDGTSQLAVKFEERRVEVKTKYLRQYMAARQLHLALYVDSTRYGQPGEDVQENRAWTSSHSNIELLYGDASGKVISRYLGTRVVDAPPVERSGIWPFEDAETYPDFIVDVDADGDDIMHTCDPQLLANYFGKNPEARHYLTPVYFRKEVLQKYYEKPSVYTVGDGYISCGQLWRLQIDNSANNSVVVFLGDIGRDLPESERGYWRSFNIAPEGRPSETMIRRSFLAQFAEPDAVDLKVRASYVRILASWKSKFDWDLYREPVEVDAGLLERLRIPLNEEQPEFESSIRILSQLLIEALNERAIQRDLSSKIPDEKGISKFERLLKEKGYPQVDRDIKFLRQLQDVRSAATAHRKSSDYESRLTAVFGRARGSAAVEQLMQSALVMLQELATWCDSLGEADD